jgi:hypothetical protein
MVSGQHSEVIDMSEKEEAKPMTQNDYDYLSRRIERLSERQREQREDHERLSKRIRLLVRILVDKKIVGEEVAKSVEETGKKDLLDWLIEQLKSE